MSGDSQLFLIERSSVERIDLVDSTRRLRLRFHQPGHGAMSPDGSRTYISRASPPAVRAIRSDASIVTDASVTQWTVALPARAQALALEPAGQWLFAAYGSKADHIAVIDTAAGRVARQWTLGKPAAALRISHDGAKLYTLSRSAGQMSIIQVADVPRWVWCRWANGRARSPWHPMAPACTWPSRGQRRWRWWRLRTCGWRRGSRCRAGRLMWRSRPMGRTWW